MLILNTFIALHIQGSWGFAILVIGLALGMAALSWKFVEKPALKRSSSPGKPARWKAATATETIVTADAGQSPA
jgi:peptidoglycan/LPS O-acetylase OafA/YrhL